MPFIYWIFLIITFALMCAVGLGGSFAHRKQWRFLEIIMGILGSVWMFAVIPNATIELPGIAWFLAFGVSAVALLLGIGYGFAAAIPKEESCIK